MAINNLKGYCMIFDLMRLGHTIMDIHMTIIDFKILLSSSI